MTGKPQVALSLSMANDKYACESGGRYRKSRYRKGSLGVVLVRFTKAFKEGKMAKRNPLTRVAVKIGRAVGKADRKARQVAQAGLVAKEELEEIAKQVEVLKRQLQKTTKRLKTALR
jgi:predicted transcriptional regulator